MAGGFLNVVPPLGISGFVAAGPDGGFDSPIPCIRISGDTAVVGTQGGFGSPIAALLIRSTRKARYGHVSLVPPWNRLGGFADAGGADERGRRTYFTYIGRTRLGR